jgi:hypothetical protein
MWIQWHVISQLADSRRSASNRGESREDPVGIARHRRSENGITGKPLSKSRIPTPITDKVIRPGFKLFDQEKLAQVDWEALLERADQVFEASGETVRETTTRAMAGEYTRLRKKVSVG